MIKTNLFQRLMLPSPSELLLGELQWVLLIAGANLWGGKRKGNYLLNSPISFQTGYIEAEVQ